MSPARKSLYIVMTLFVVSRAFYAATGIEYQPIQITIAFQLLDVGILRDDFLRNILYLHSQPPLFNSFSALALKLAPTATDQLLQAVFVVIGLGINCAWSDSWKGSACGHG